MAISYTLQPIPFWYFSDLDGKPLAGGKMVSMSSLNPTQFKPIYQDPAGVNEWPTDGAPFDATGTSGPFYFKLDDADPDDLYFLQIFNKDGNLVRQIDQYPISGGSGGGTINTVQKINNIFVNSSFLYNIGSTTVQPIADQTFLCPSAHSGLFYHDTNFIQSGISNAQDTITFSQFNIGTNPITPDFAPPYFINYTCLNNPTGEVYKGIRIPISPYVNTISNQIFTMTLQARSNGSGANTLNVQLRQYFGTGGSPSPDQVTVLTGVPLTLTGSFVLYSISFTVPSVATKTLGNSQDDGTYIEIMFPLSQSCNIDIAKPSLFVGSIFPNTIYEPVEETLSQVSTPRTGFIQTELNPFANSLTIQPGWIPLNDGTIGNLLSNATTRKNSDSWLLYKMIWEGTTAANCPLYNSVGTPVVKGGSAVSDWNANNQISLPKNVGRVTANRGTGTTVAQAYTSNFTTDLLTVASTTGFITGNTVLFGTSAPSPLSLGVTYFAIVVSPTTLRVAYSAENAIAGIFIDLTTNTNGTIFTPSSYNVAQFQGENQHQLTIGEIPSHNHPGSTQFGGTPGVAQVGGTTQFLLNLGNRALNISSQGGNLPHNNVQPTVFYNMIIKL